MRLRSDEQERLRLAREIRALQRLEHANVIRLRAVYPEDFVIMLVFDLMRSDLRSLLAGAAAPLPAAAIKGIAQQLLRGVSYCHAQGVLHRDIKPANLLLSADGVLKLADFGLARLHVPDGRPYSHQVATRWYRSPSCSTARSTTTAAATCGRWAASSASPQPRAALRRVSPAAYNRSFSPGCVPHTLALCCSEHDIDQLGRVISMSGTKF